jgi:hypothetical protein
MLENATSKSADIIYPDKYYLKSVEEVTAELKMIKENMPLVPSKSFQQYCGKQIAWLLLGNCLPAKEMDKIYTEIEDAKATFTDPTAIYNDIEQGILAKKYAAELKNYPIDSVDIANKEQSERLDLIAKSQAQGQGMGAAANPAARGIPDASADPSAAVKAEKTAAEAKAGGDITRGKEKTVNSNQAGAA